MSEARAVCSIAGDGVGRRHPRLSFSVKRARAASLVAALSSFAFAASAVAQDQAIGAAQLATQDSVQASEAAGASGSTDVDLAKKLSNPVASLISVPFQFNWDTGIGPKDADSIVLNIQPVVPFSLNEDWNLISRTILPVRWRGSPAVGVGEASGLGDVVQSLFFSPVQPVSGWILGAGPVFLVPTATDSAFQSRQFGAGPTVVGLRQQGGWTYGGLVNHVWGVNNPNSREQVNATFLQPFVSYTWPSATTAAINTESTYDWSSNEWTVPINASVSQLVSIGDQKLSLQFGGRIYADRPRGGPDWGLRANVTFLFPE